MPQTSKTGRKHHCNCDYCYEAAAEIERLRSMLTWIETYDPQIVEDAKMRFPELKD